MVSFLYPAGTSGAKFDFLVDTGSDTTTLNPGDGKRMGVNYSSLAYIEQTYGIGSKHKDAVVSAFVIFATESGELPFYRIQLSIAPYKPKLEILPSLLGTDILRRLQITWNFPERILDFEVLSCDGIVTEGELRTP